MKNIVWNINIEYFKESIFRRFKELCGFFESSDIDKDRIDEAVFCFEKFFNCFKAKSVYSFFNKDIFRKNKIYIDKNTWIEFEKCGVCGFVFFALSIDTDNDKIKYFFQESFLKEFYFDWTGTAIIDTARSILKHKLLKDNFFVSEAFGIGFFRITKEDILRVFQFIDYDKIGLIINERGIMKPDKSFLGFFAISEKEIIISNDCSNCIGNKRGCFLCKK